MGGDKEKKKRRTISKVPFLTPREAQTKWRGGRRRERNEKEGRGGEGSGSWRADRERERGLVEGLGSVSGLRTQRDQRVVR